jgi:hypothetical protein
VSDAQFGIFLLQIVRQLNTALAQNDMAELKGEVDAVRHVLESNAVLLGAVWSHPGVIGVGA